MRQILRFYVRHDLDLINLKLNGVSLGKLAKNVLEAYANNQSITIQVPYQLADKTQNKDLMDKILSGSKNNKPLPKAASFRCDFNTTDPNAIRVLQSIKPTYRNQFMKALIRNSLSRISLIQYFKESGDMTPLEIEYMKIEKMKSNVFVAEAPIQEDEKIEMSDVLQTPEERKKTAKKQNIVISEENNIEMPVQKKIISDISEVKKEVENKINQTPEFTEPEEVTEEVMETETETSKIMMDSVKKETVQHDDGEALVDDNESQNISSMLNSMMQNY